MRKDFFYTPNHIPANERWQNIAFSIALFAYGSYGVWINDLYLPANTVEEFICMMCPHGSCMAR